MFRSGKQGWVGIDLGAGAVKVAQVQRQRSRLQLVDAAIVPRQQATDEASNLSDEILGGLSLAAGISGRRAAGILSMQQCDFHALRIEQTSADAEKLQRELAAIAPGNWGNRTIGAWPIDHPSDGPNPQTPNVGVISTVTSNADAAASALAKSKLDCRTLDALPTALARAMPWMIGNRDVVLAAVDWGFSRTTISFVRQGRPLYVRCPKGCAFADASKAMCQALACSPSELTGLLQRYGISDGESARGTQSECIFRTMRPHLDLLVTEISRTLRYIGTHRRNLAPAGLVLFGVGATIKGLPAWLSEATGIAVRTWQPDSRALSVPDDLNVPVVLLAPALAASALAWER